MRNFEMPKMNISIFSGESVVIKDSVVTQAKAALAAQGVDIENNVTVTTADQWINAAN